MLTKFLPLPKGEGRGEGEGDENSPTALKHAEVAHAFNFKKFFKICRPLSVKILSG